MLGRDWIIYILKNHLEDEPVFEDGRLLGFITDAEAAIKYDVGVSTIKLWYELCMIHGIEIGGQLYILANDEDPRKLFKGDEL